MIQNQKNMKKGAALLFIIFALLFFVLFIRIFYIQITGRADGHSLKNEALQKYMKTDVLEARRGTIYDRQGEPIAEDTTSYTMAAILSPSITTNPEKPSHVVDPEMTAATLAKYIDMSESDIYKQLTKKDVFQVEFGSAGRGLSNQVKSEIEKENLPGIVFSRESKRFYPNGTFASHLIGFAQKMEETKGKETVVKTIGQMGIEKAYDDYLQGKNGRIQYKSDLWGYLLPNKKEMVEEPEHGDDIYLTIDSKIQAFLEDAMTEVEEKHNPESIIAVVANPKTGEILAMGQRPTFHPDTREGLSNNWRNVVVENSFEPGSTVKIFTLAAAVEEGTFTPNAYFKSGRYKVGGGSIRDHNGGEGWGNITYLEGIQRSSNVAIANMLDQMGADTFRKYIDEFGFGKKTGIDLPNEDTGSILYHYPIEKVTTAFGQGSTATAIQIIQGATAIANDGKMMKPYVIEKIIDPNTKEIVKQGKPKVVNEPISKETAQQVRDILGTVVTGEHGTGAPYKIEGYEVAGKTGTAQIPGPNGGYLSGRENYVFSFIGMAPKDDPQLIVYVAVKKPELKNEAGSAAVAKIFNPVMKNSLQYLNIKPKNTEVAKTVNVKDYQDRTASEVVKEAKLAGLEPIVIGKGEKVTNQYPEPDTPLLEGEKLLVRTNGDLTVPNMEGWSLRDVMKVADLAGLKLSVNGEGYVLKQNLKPNSPIKENDHLVVTLSDPKTGLEEKKREAEEEEQKEKGQTEEEQAPLD